jgi:flavin-dependent dehydrogenase
MIQCETDPCVFYRVTIQGYLDHVITCHVGDLIIAGSKPAIDEYLKDFEKHLKIERLGRMKKTLEYGGHGKKMKEEFT